MNALMIKCPKTGQLIPTGIETDELSLRLTDNVTSRAWCRHCNDEHEWQTQDAFLMDGVVAISARKWSRL